MHAQAFVQYKTAAANSLTDWAFVRAQYRDTVLPTAGVLRQFEELFRQHNVVVMGHSVDLGSAVAAHVQGLLYSNADTRPRDLSNSKRNCWDYVTDPCGILQLVAVPLGWGSH